MRAWVLPWLGFLAFLALIFGASLLDGRVLATGDGLAQDLPARLLVATAFQHGEWPFWNPYIFGGMPLLAALQAGAFFPGNLPFLVLSPVAAMNATVLLAYLVAGTGAMAYARALGLAGSAGLGLAMVLTGGGFLAQNVMHVPIVQAASVLPWLLWAIERSAGSARPWYALTAGLLVALTCLAGHPQMTAFGLVLAAGYTLARAFSLARGTRARFLGGLALATALGIGLAAVQLWPAIDLVQASQRQGMTYAKLTTPSPAPVAAVLLFFPFLAGVRNPGSLLSTPFWAQEWTIWLPAYVGLTGLALVLLGLSRWRELPIVRIWAGIAAFSLLLALGAHTPLYRLWTALPPFNAMPYPTRHFMEFSLALAVLAGIGLDKLVRGQASLPVRWGVLGALWLPLIAVWAGLAWKGAAFAARTQPFLPPGVQLSRALSFGHPAVWGPGAVGLALALVLLGLAGRPRVAAACILALLGMELGLVSTFQGIQAACPVLERPLDVPWPPPEQGRAYVVPARAYPYYGPVEPLLALGAPNLSVFAGTRTVNGYDAFIYRRFGELTTLDSSGYTASPLPWREANRTFDLMGLTRLKLDAAVAATPEWRARLASPRWKRLASVPGTAMFENGHALPRAWRPARRLVLDPPAVDARVLGKAPFEPLAEVLLERPVAGEAWTAGEARVTSRGFNRLQLETRGPGAGCVVVSESFDPGWRATTATGTPCPVHRVDGVILGVEVPAGAQAIDLVYEPAHWRAGLAISLLSLLGFALWGRASRRRWA